MDSYQNIHASLLRFCSDNALNLKTLYAETFTPVVIDAYADDNELPETQLIGIENLAVVSASDKMPFDTFSVLITIGLRNDTNNMLLSKVTGNLFEQLRPAHEIMLLDCDDGSRLGTMKLKGRTSIMPIMRSPAGIVFRSISITGSAPIR